MSDLHHDIRELRFMLYKAMHAQGMQFWIALAICLFAVVFLIVGLMRVVEITALKLSKLKQWILIVAHVIGCVLFAIALGILGLDVTQTHQSIVGVFLISAMLLLLPTHIYIGLIRRIRLRDASAKTSL